MKKVFEDFDAYAAAIESANCRHYVKKWQSPYFALQHIYLGGILIQHGWENNVGWTEGMMQEDGIGFFFSIDDPDGQWVNGQKIRKNSVVLIEPGSEFCISGSNPNHWCSLFFPLHVLEKIGVELNALLPGPKPTCRLVHLDPIQYNDLFLAIERITLTHDYSPESLQHPIGVTSATSYLVKSFPLPRIDNLPDPSENTRCSLSRGDIIRQSRLWLERQGKDPINVSDWSHALDVSERSLRYAFQDYFGVSPVRFLKLRQLHRVRHDLKRASEDASSVSQIFTRHGVWEFGRFAQYYRQVFGELPSQTLKKDCSL